MSRNVAGISRAGGPEPARSTRTLVSSSMKSGMPSVRSMIWSTVAPGQRLVARKISDQFGALFPRQAIEVDLGHMGSAEPRRRELGAERDHEQERKFRRAVDHHAQKLERRRINPVNVLEYQENRLTRQSFKLRHQRLQRLFAPLLWGELQRRITSLSRNRKQLGDQRRGLGKIGGRAGPASPPACPAFDPAVSSRRIPAALSSCAITG